MTPYLRISMMTIRHEPMAAVMAGGIPIGSLRGICTSLWAVVRGICQRGI